MGLARCVGLVASGTADCMDKAHASDARSRVITRAGMAGSAAVGDCIVDVFAGNVKVATLSNSTAGAAKEPIDVDMKAVKGFVPRNLPIQVVPRAAPTTNQIVVYLEIEPYVRVGGARSTSVVAGSKGGYDFNAWKAKKIAQGTWRGTV